MAQEMLNIGLHHLEFRTWLQKLDISNQIVERDPHEAVQSVQVLKFQALKNESWRKIPCGLLFGIRNPILLISLVVSIIRDIHIVTGWSPY